MVKIKKKYYFYVALVWFNMPFDGHVSGSVFTSEMQFYLNKRRNAS